jgi:hypothetical protein
MDQKSFFNKVNGKINSLLLEKTSLENQLVYQRGLNESEWEIYGSELSSGDILNYERIITDKIEKIEADIKFLRYCCANGWDSKHLTHLIEKSTMFINGLEEDAKVVNERLSKEKEFLAKIRHILELLEIK